MFLGFFFDPTGSGQTKRRESETDECKVWWEQGFAD